MTIISFQHRFIFVKTMKTAGTSIEVELSRMVEPGAIVTPVIPPEAEHEPRNYKRGLLRKDYYNHMPAAQIRDFLGKRAYDEKFSFCVERDPITKCLSHYNMLLASPFHTRRRNEHFTWNVYCEQGLFPIDIDKYAVQKNGTWELIVDEVVPYETLQASLNKIGEKVGLGPIAMNSKAKGDYPQDKKVRREDVTAAQQELILEAFAPSLRVAGLMDCYA